MSEVVRCRECGMFSDGEHNCIPATRVISFGAGVQSSALLLMSDRGEIPRADVAIFADTGAEPDSIYRWLEKMKNSVSIPILVIQKGNIVDEVISHWKGQLKRCGQPPLFASRNGKAGMLRRHCTKEYKIEPVDKAIRQFLGYKPRHKIKHKVHLYMGISYDEMERMRESTIPWKTNFYPLVDLKLRRGDCIKYVEKLGLGTPPRSACYFCPYKSDAEWRKLRDEEPQEWEKAIEFDRAIRKSVRPQLSSEFFIHRSRKPLEDADISLDDRQITMLDECDGMCGV